MDNLKQFINEGRVIHGIEPKQEDTNVLSESEIQQVEDIILDEASNKFKIVDDAVADITIEKDGKEYKITQSGKHIFITKAVLMQLDGMIKESTTLDEAELSPLQKEYKKYFQEILNEFEVDSPTKLSEEKKKEFFTKIRSGWTKGEGRK